MNRIYPKATAGVIIYRKIKDKIEVLLTKRNVEPFKDYWCFPGGHIEPFEKVIDAAKREVLEEIGIEVNPIFFNYYDEIFPEINLHNVVLFFFSECVVDNLEINSEEVSDFIWTDVNDALNYNLAFNHKKALEDFIISMNKILK